MNYQGILYIDPTGEPWRVKDGRIRLSVGVLDDLWEDPRSPLISGDFGRPSSNFGRIDVVRTKNLPLGDAFWMRNKVIVGVNTKHLRSTT